MVEPLSPEELKNDWPWAAISSRIVFSALIVGRPVSDSHTPHELETTLATFSEAIALRTAAWLSAGGA